MLALSCFHKALSVLVFNLRVCALRARAKGVDVLQRQAVDRVVDPVVLRSPLGDLEGKRGFSGRLSLQPARDFSPICPPFGGAMGGGRAQLLT